MKKQKPTKENSNINPEEIKVSKSFLENLQKEIDELKAKQILLEEAADKKAISLAYQRRTQDELPKEIRVREIGGKVIVGWRTTQDEVYQDPITRRYQEIQKVEVLYEDGTSEEMHLTDFNRQFTYVPCKRVGVMSDEKTGNVAYKLERSDGKGEIIIGSSFVN